MILEPGVLLNRRYTILEVIARGGMGAIYRANDESLGVEVAVKENLFSTEEFSRQFRREATILASLRHDHLPRVTDHFVLEDQGQYLVMDFIPGEDLRHHVSTHGRLSEAETLEIGLAISDALAYLHHHEPPILHRDIKPGNIKITPTGQVYLVDFGLAKFVQSGQQTTIGAQSLTPGYAPPEQYGRGTDQRSDIYSLAATLYSLLTGKTPEDALSRAMGASVLTPVRTHNPKVSEAAAQVIERGMAVEPEKRFQTADEFFHALQAAAHRTRPGAGPTIALKDLQAGGAGGAGAKVPASSGSAASPSGRTGSMPWLAVGVVVLLLAGGATGLIFGPRLLQPKPAALPTLPPAPSATAAALASPPTRLPAPTSLPAVLPTLAPSALPTTQASPTSAAPLPTPMGGGPGSIAFASNRGGNVQVWTMDLASGGTRQVTQMQDGACQPAWSPDGKRLAFISPCKGEQDTYPGSTLFLINPDGSGVVSLATTPGGDFDPAFSPDGTQLAFTSLRDGKPHIYLYSLADNKATRLSPMPVYDRQPAWSPDGKSLAFTTTRQGHLQVWTMGADGKNAREFSLFDRGLASMPVWSPDGKIIYFIEGPQQLTGLIAKRLNDMMNEFPIAPSMRPISDPHFSPDGEWLIFEGQADGKPGLFRMTPTGTNLTRLTDGQNIDFQPAWQP